jgi:hypothetical protein
LEESREAAATIQRIVHVVAVPTAAAAIAARTAATDTASKGREHTISTATGITTTASSITDAIDYRETASKK